MCLSNDSATVQAKDGRAVYIGSICGTFEQVKLTFMAKSAITGTPKLSPTTAAFDVTGICKPNFLNFRMALVIELVCFFFGIKLSKT